MRISIMGSGQGLGGLQTHFTALLRFAIREGHETHALVVADRLAGFTPPPGLAGLVRAGHGSATAWEKARKGFGIVRCEAHLWRHPPALFVAAAPGYGYAKVAAFARRRGAFTLFQEVTPPPAGDPLHTAMRAAVDAVAVQTPAMEGPFRAAIPGASLLGCLPCFFEPPGGEALARPPEPGEEIRLGYFGRLAGNKGLVPFLRVFREIAHRFPVRLDLHGDGEAKAEILAAIAELHLSDRVTLRGRYPSGPEYGRLLAGCHALVLPSIDCEGLPLVLLEAMSCGLPFLATNIGGIRDVTAGNPDAVLAEADPASLTRGLTQLLERLQARAFSNAGLRARYEQEFAPAVVERAWRKLFADPRGFFAAERVVHPATLP